MKKIVLIIAIITSILIYSEIKKNTVVIPNSAIRLRVIPNSNSAQDQNIKKQVKTYLEKNTYNILKDEKSIKEARKKINENIPVIEENVGRIFKDNNYDVSYNVNYGYNYFPSKTYRGITYKEGYYESIVISIGAAEGDNWWCVLFPNLCLADLEQKENSEYKSWVIETINKIF